ANWRGMGRSSGSLPQALCALVVSRLVFISAGIPVSRDNSPLGRKNSGANSITHQCHPCKEQPQEGIPGPPGKPPWTGVPVGVRPTPQSEGHALAGGGRLLTRPDRCATPGGSRHSGPSRGGTRGG